MVNKMIHLYCRLLQEMGWHEHSDNEEGYAPITEDEMKEFQRRSQQVSLCKRLMVNFKVACRCNLRGHFEIYGIFLS